MAATLSRNGSPRKKSRSPRKAAPPPVSAREWMRLTEAEQVRYHNPAGDCDEAEHIEVVESIQGVLDQHLAADVHPPAPWPIWFLKVGPKGAEHFVRRRRNGRECRLAHIDLALPEIYFDPTGPNAYRNAAAALDEVIALLRKAADEIGFLEALENPENG